MHRSALVILKEKSASPQSRIDALWRLLEDAPQAELPDALKAILADAGDHADVRSAAALTLGKLGREARQAAEFVEALSVALGDADATVRHYAARALGALGSPLAAPALIRALSDADHLVFHTAAESLGRLGQEACPPLLALLESDAPDDARCIAAWKLGEAGWVAGVGALAQAVRRETNVELIALCVWALGEIGRNEDSALTALHWAREHPERAVSERARRALRKIARHYN